MDKNRKYNLTGLTLGILLMTISVVGQISTDSLNNWVEGQLNSTMDTGKVFRNAHLSLSLTRQVDIESNVIGSYLNLARYHEKYGSIDSAIFYFTVLKDIYKNSGNKIAVAETCLEINGLYSSKAAYADCMKEVYEALELYEEIGNQQGIANCYTHICDLLYYEDKYEESVEYCNKAIAIQKELDAKSDLAKSYRYKASSLLFVEGALEEALETINKAITLYHEMGETGIPLLASLNGRGNILKYMKRYDDAIADYQFIYDKCLALGLDRYTIPSIANIGHVYVMQEKYAEALPYHMEAIELMKQTGNTKNLWENYMHVSDIYNGLGDYKNAYDYNILYSGEYSKYLYTIIDRLESEAQIKYETAKKDETIYLQEAKIENQRIIQILYTVIAILLVASLLGMIRSRWNIRKKQKEIENSREELEQSLDNLKATQSQLVHAEKMASLGELTAGIAHEIQNPLNFVKNFSEVNAELIGELSEEIDNGDLKEAKALINDIAENEEKIIHHGKRADSIVKGMLQHSRTTTGDKEATDMNVLADEYLRLAYHGLKAKDNSFNADFKTDLDKNIPNIKVVPQDIGRVLLNLVNNAFYACAERSRSSVAEKSENADQGYKPLVTIITKNETDKIMIKVMDNGNGIPSNVKDKIFQPFFTTKPTGEGTGLGLSLSYDIITKGHGGELNLKTIVNEGSTFIIQLPI